MITEDMLPAMQGIIPSNLVTCSKDGSPNASYISQVYYVDESHVALSFQFFNKTVKNVRENPAACILIYHPETFDSWDIRVRFSRSETDGELFDNMEMQLEAIASMSGMEGVFKLQAADVYEVVSVKKNTELMP